MVLVRPRGMHAQFQATLYFYEVASGPLYSLN